MSDSDAGAIRSSLQQPAAFEVVFDRHFEAVHAFAQRRVGSDLADEIAGETFARAFAGRTRYAFDREDARPWLLGIASNLLRRHWRTERRRLEAYARAVQPLVGERHASLASTPVAAALAQLSRDERETVLLHVLGDLSYEEVAVALDRPVGTIRSRISRARYRLRAALADDSGFPYHLKESSHA